MFARQIRRGVYPVECASVQFFDNPYRFISGARDHFDADTREDIDYTVGIEPRAPRQQLTA
jgi:hypothetical protein